MNPDITWLHKPLDKNDSRHGLRQPFSVVIDGIPYAVATNGRGLVMINGDYGLAEAPEVKLVKMLCRHLPGPTHIETTIEKLKAWCGDPLFADGCKLCNGTDQIPCRDCDGEGVIDCYNCGHDMECGACEGSKTECCPEHNINKKGEYGRIGRVPMNKKLLARFIYGLTGPATIAVDAPDKAIHFYGEGWRVLIMPVKEDHMKGMDVSSYLADPEKAA